MKKLTMLFVGLLIGLVSYSQTYNFTKPTLTKVGEYTQINQAVCNNYGLVGDPLLPYYTVKTELNYNQSISSVSIVSVEYYPTETNIKLQYKDTEFTDISNYVPATPSIIYSATKYPLDIISGLNNMKSNNKMISTFMICPLVYYPNKNEVKFIKSITIKKNISTLKNIQQPVQLSTITEPYDLLIITKNDFVTVTNPYVLYKQKQGYYTKLITTESIYSTYTGVDKQEKIRNCIKDYYQNHGIQYVFLVGTSLPSVPSKDVIPHRGMWGNYPFPDGRPETDIPSDVYYSNLDGTWRDSDGHYGTIGTEDLTPEIAIGRLPAVFDTDITNWVNKVIKYQDSPVINDILYMGMVGELVNPSYQLYGSKDMENLISSTPIPSRYSYRKLYDSLNVNNTTYDKVLGLYNNGTHIINHLGHSGCCWNMNLSCGYYISRTGQQWLFNDGINKTYTIVYSQGCYSGALDKRDGTPKYTATDPWDLRCVSGEAVDAPNGCVAYITNTRYGFYGFNSDGSSQRYQREFLKALFNKNITKIGDAMNESKNMIAPFIPGTSGGYNIRWTYYTLSLWGDPTMEIWTDVPSDIIATYPTSVSYGITQIEFSTNTSNARVACVSNSGVLLGRGITNSNGNVTITLNQPLSNINYLDVSIIGSNKNRFNGRINVNYSQVTGFVTYNNSSNTILPNFTVRLYNENMENYLETTTNSSGLYTFYSVPPGTYNIKVVTNNTVGGINAIDAQLIMNHFAGIKKLTGLKLKAADVDNNGYVNSTDALIVSKWFVGDVSNLPPNANIGKWCFEDKIANVNKINVVVTIKGLCYGDVDGSYKP